MEEQRPWELRDMLAISVESRGKVDDIANRALEAGGSPNMEPQDHGWMYGRSFHDPELDEVSLRLLSATGYKGLGGVEFKKDPRDECYKLIEFNTRLGLWDCFGMRCGVDIPYIAYCDALEQPVTPQRTYREGMFWVDFQRDARAFLILRQRLGIVPLKSRYESQTHHGHG